MKPGLGSSARARRGLGVLGTTSFFQHLPSPAPRPPGSGAVAPSDLREHRDGPRAPAPPADPGASRPLPAPFSSPSVPLPLRFPPGNGVSPLESCCGWVSPRHPVSPPGAAGGGCVGSPGFGFPLPPPSRGLLPLLLGYLRGLESLERAPSWPQQQWEPWRGGQAEIPACGIIPSLPAWPRGSLGSGFPCQNTPNPPSAPGGELGHPLASPTTSFGCLLPSSPVAFPGFGGGGCQYYTAAAFPGAGLGGLLVPTPLPNNLGLFMERGAS